MKKYMNFTHRNEISFTWHSWGIYRIELFPYIETEFCVVLEFSTEKVRETTDLMHLKIKGTDVGVCASLKFIKSLSCVEN